MGLDQRGDIAIAQLVVYVFLFFITLILVFRHGFSRRAGWLPLLILAIMRIVGSSIHIASEEQSNPSRGLISAYTTLESAGLSPLMIATIGFLGTVSQQAFEGNYRVSRALRLMGVVATVALALAIAGGVELGSATKQSDVNQGNTLRHVGAILFVVLYGLIILMHGYFYLEFDNIRRHRRNLLVGISAALPFLAVRVVYAILSAYAPFSVPGLSTTHNSLSKFSSFSGSWAIYLVMSVLMEIIVVIVYCLVGLSIKLQDDFKEEQGGAMEMSGYGRTQY